MYKEKDQDRLIAFSKGFILCLMAAFLSIAAFDSANTTISAGLTAAGTNGHLFHDLFTFHTVNKELPAVGKAISWRSVHSEVFVGIVVWLTLLLETTASILLWVAGASFLLTSINKCSESKSLFFATIALLNFITVYLLFLGGGYFFDYWRVFITATLLHLGLVILGMVNLIYIQVHYRPKK